MKKVTERLARFAYHEGVWVLATLYTLLGGALWIMGMQFEYMLKVMGVGVFSICGVGGTLLLFLLRVPRIRSKFQITEFDVPITDWTRLINEVAFNIALFSFTGSVAGLVLIGLWSPAVGFFLFVPCILLTPFAFLGDAPRHDPKEQDGMREWFFDEIMRLERQRAQRLRGS